MFWQIAETLLTAERKTAGFSIPSVFVFIPPSLSLSLSLYFSHSPPTVVFAPIVTTQQPALPSSDWWISCDGGGLSERDLSALKQLSLPIHISSTAKERAGAASALAATAAKAKSLLFVDVEFVISCKNHKTRSRQRTSIFTKVLVFSFFLLLALCLRPAEAQVPQRKLISITKRLPEASWD